jgi:hypothetical protein
MPIVAGSVIAFFTFGVPVAVVAWLVFARRWTSMAKVTVVVLGALVLWVPAGFLGAVVSEAFPVDWGHAGIGYVAGYVVGSALVALVLIGWLASRIRHSPT